MSAILLIPVAIMIPVIIFIVIIVMYNMRNKSE